MALNEPANNIGRLLPDGSLKIDNARLRPWVRGWASRDWDALEADARRDWETRQPGTWARFHDAIRHAWEAVRGRH